MAHGSLGCILSHLLLTTQRTCTILPCRLRCPSCARPAPPTAAPSAPSMLTVSWFLKEVCANEPKVPGQSRSVDVCWEKSYLAQGRASPRSLSPYPQAIRSSVLRLKTLRPSTRARRLASRRTRPPRARCVGWLSVVAAATAVPCSAVATTELAGWHCCTLQWMISSKTQQHASLPHTSSACWGEQQPLAAWC